MISRACVRVWAMAHRQTGPVTMDVFHSVRSICCDVYTREDREEVVNLLHYLCLSTLELSELVRIYWSTLSFLMAHSSNSSL